MIRILSIDGGGIRGIIPAMVLGELERLAGRPAASLFDLMAGTSTGGIIVCALAMPGRDGEPSIEAGELVRFYEEKGRKIFHRSLVRIVATLDGLVEERYSSKALENILHEFFGEVRLRQALTPLLVPAYEIERRSPFFFKSHRAVRNDAYDFLMWEVARATSAGPVYFEPARIFSGAVISYALVDGGVFANNPAMCALTEMISLWEGEAEALMVSLGTGQQNRPIPYDKARKWGLRGWALPLFDVMMDGVSDTVDYQLSQLLDPSRYFRFQTELTIADDDMDDVSPLNIQHLKRQAEKLIAREHARLEELARLLVESGPSE